MKAWQTAILLVAAACLGSTLVFRGANGVGVARRDADNALPWYEAALDASLDILVDGRLEGSGWLSAREGHAITAAHVVGAPGKRVEVLTRKGKRVPATVVAVDYGNDAAILRAPGIPGPGLAFARAMPSAGTPIHLIGSPLYRHRLVVPGCVASDAASFEWTPPCNGYVQVFHVAAMTPPGFSGGAWLDAEGHVVGLQSGMMTSDRAPMGIAFVASCDALAQLLADRKTRSTPTLGAAVEEVWEQSNAFLARLPERTTGGVLRNVGEGPCAAAGLKDGDVIQKIGNRPVALRDELQRLVRARSTGDAVEVTVLRPGEVETRKTAIKLAAMENAWLSAPQP